MWKQLLVPLGLVILIWITMSVFTTLFIANTDRDYQRILEENVASIESAGDLRALSWRMLIAVNSMRVDEVTKAVDSIDAILVELGRIVTKLEQSSASDREKLLLKQMASSLESVSMRSIQLRMSKSSDKSEELAKLTELIAETSNEVAVFAKKISGLNREIINDSELSRKKQLSRMMILRNTTLFVGPLLGIVLGWQMTGRLQRRVSTLAITLKDAAERHTFQLGEVSLKGSDQLSDAQSLSEQVVLRLNQVAKELDRAEREVVQSERLAAVGELAAGVAHELRNPLTSVKLLLQHAAHHAATTDKPMVDVDNLSLVLSEIGRMEDTIKGLLDFARPRKTQFVYHDLLAPLDRAVNLIRGRAKASNIAIVYNPSEVPVMLHGDSEQLHLVFVNLLINAMESIKSGGTVVVAVATGAHPHSVEVSFRDSGQGIPLEIVDRLFEPFGTTKEHGTGLGLALCHRIVSAHHGRIDAWNEAGGGAVFKLFLPVKSLESQSVGFVDAV
jgi:signal transduction histidine kinase